MDDVDNSEIWFGKSTQTKLVDYVDLHYPKSAKILDVGCGNGQLLFALASRGFSHLEGVDYSQPAISLAKKGASHYHFSDIITFEHLDFGKTRIHKPYDLILDKGTYDAICLSGDAADARAYEQLVTTLMTLQANSTFILTSCNWTTSELKQRFTRAGLVPHDEIKYTQITFGGKSGSPVSTVVFKAL